MTKIGAQGIYQMATAFENTSAIAKTIFVFASGENELNLFSGFTNGKLVPPRGIEKFGWDSIFLPNDKEKTYSEMNFEEKQLCSHRGKALTKLISFLKSKK